MVISVKYDSGMGRECTCEYLIAMQKVEEKKKKTVLLQSALGYKKKTDNLVVPSSELCLVFG